MYLASTAWGLLVLDRGQRNPSQVGVYECLRNPPDVLRLALHHFVEIYVVHRPPRGERVELLGMPA